MEHSIIDNKGYDKERDNYLLALEIKTVRFWNNEVEANMNGVLQKIINMLSSPSH